MGQEVSKLVEDVGQEIERMERQSSSVRNASDPFESLFQQGQTSSRSVGKNRFTDSQKSLIRNAIRKVTENADEDSSPSEYEELLYECLKQEFCNHQCLLTPKVGMYTPDVVVKGVGVFEVKHRSWRNINSSEKEKIELYMKELSLPGVLVNFPTDGIPYVRWYILDEGKPKSECNETIELRSSAAYLTQEGSSDYSTSGLRSNQIHQNSSGLSTGQRYIQTQQSSSAIQTQQSSSGLSTGAAVGIGVGVAAAVAALGYAFYEAEGRQRKNSTDEE